jgi:PadR family transcriptional regulator, regulatory protein PadR
MTEPLSYTAALVLNALVRGHSYGFEIVHATELPTGTVYPLLRRLEARGLVESKWEDESAAHAAGRPARRHYRPTAAGEVALGEATERIRAQQRLLGEEPGTAATAG